MEFNTNFSESLPLHSSFFPEEPYQPPMGNELLTKSTSSNGPYQNVSPFDKSFTGGSLSNLSVGYGAHFYDPYNPSQSLTANESLMSLGSIGSNSVLHQNVGISNYHPRIFFQDLNGKSLNGEAYFGSKNSNSFNEFSRLNDEGWNQKKPDPKDKPQLKGKRKSVGQSTVVKGPWTPEEDSRLLSLVNEYEKRSWTEVANILGGRAGKQCRERWFNHLRPDIKKDKVTGEEEVILVARHKQFGSKWSSIAKFMPGRSENAIKNHFNSSRKRLLSKLGGTTKTYLENYIKNCFSNSSNTGLPHSQSPGPIVEVVGASSGLEHKDQMVPNDNADVALPFFLDEKVFSEEKSLASILNETPNNLSSESKSSAPNLGVTMDFNVEDDAEFLKLAGWN